MPLAVPWSERAERAIAQASAAVAAKRAEAAWLRGSAMTPPQVLARLRGAAPSRGQGPRSAGSLSRRESEVADLVAAGLTNRAIAERLFLAERTVESHVDHILTKTGLRNRTELAAWSRANQTESRQSSGPSG